MKAVECSVGVRIVPEVTRTSLDTRSEQITTTRSPALSPGRRGCRVLRKASGPSPVWRTGSRSSSDGRSVRRQKRPIGSLVAPLVAAVDRRVQVGRVVALFLQHLYPRVKPLVGVVLVVGDARD